MDVGCEVAKSRRDQRLRDLEEKKKDVDVSEDIINKNWHGHPKTDKNGHLSPHVGPVPESKKDHLKRLGGDLGVALGVKIGLIDDD